MTAPSATHALPDILNALKQRVCENMRPGDVTAQELVDSLTIAWVAAERWRLEQDEDCWEAEAPDGVEDIPSRT
jgi:hypothetical protein